MKLLLSLAISALVCAGCATQTRSVTNKDGVTTTTSSKMFLETMQGYSDQSVDSDGAILYSTQIQNIQGDVQMIMAIDQLIQHTAQLALAASGNTNIIGTNYTALFRPTMKFALKPRPAP
jgi:PBP1b-binding outer membrane lipoprotein LpoB